MGMTQFTSETFEVDPTGQVRGQTRIRGWPLRGFRDQGETSSTHSDSLSALIPHNLPTDTGCNTGLNRVDTRLGRGSKSLPDGNYSHLGGLDAQSFSEKVESSSGLIEESQITSQQSEIIEKVGLNPTNPVEISKPLSDGNSSQLTNHVLTPCESLDTPYSSDESTPQFVATSNQPPTKLPPLNPS